MTDLVWLVPLLPLVGGLVLMVFGARIGEPRAGWLATLLTASSFVVTVLVYLDLLGMPAEERSHVVSLFSWIPVGSLQI
ncbi:MAG: NADH-quinone oxidoreductase subunit L, partial [Actinomycetota bacterium]